MESPIRYGMLSTITLCLNGIYYQEEKNPHPVPPIRTGKVLRPYHGVSITAVWP